MANRPAKPLATVLLIATVACWCLLYPAPVRATDCVVEVVTLALVQGRVRYITAVDSPRRAAVGVRVQVTTTGAHDPEVVAAVNTDDEGRFAFKRLAPGRPYVVSFKASDAYGLVNVQLDPSSPHKWLTMDLDKFSGKACPANRATVGEAE